MSGPGIAPVGLFQALHPLYLASASPRRQAFLTDLGLSHMVLTPDHAAEPLPLPDEPPALFAQRAARAKARNVAAKVAASGVNGRPAIIAADTVVALGDCIFGKPSGPDHALAMLKELAGRTHQVTTACSVLVYGGSDWTEETFSLTSEVSMWAASDAMLRAYAQCGEPLDKAGGYAVQGLGSFLIQSISGSWTNVVGLPLTELIEALLRLGIIRGKG